MVFNCDVVLVRIKLLFNVMELVLLVSVVCTLSYICNGIGYVN
jgi:hypothetical protein